MKTIRTLIATLLIAPASTAFAQDADTGQSPAAGFSGTRIEAFVGWDHLNAKSTKDIDATAQATGSGDAVAYGGAIGYDVALDDHVTLGAEFAAQGTAAKWDNTANLVAGTFNTATVNAGRDLFAGARLGYALGTKTLVYGKLGYANSHFGITATNGTDTLYQGINANGYRLGVGVEHKLNKIAYVKLGYDFSHYGTGQFNFGGSTPDTSNLDLHTDRHQLLAGVGLRF